MKKPMNDLPDYDFKLGGSLFVLFLIAVVIYTIHQMK